ncbi:MAG TPA: hypothetical protein VHS58_08130 [Acetobacteraceae bacterium]|jgi:hypothetical protein|nr:hypothetical protein [Acetobacteraceae bacterium]
MIPRLGILCGTVAVCAPLLSQAAGSIDNSGSCVAIIQGNWNTATVNCSEPGPVYPPEPRDNHVWETPALGIRFEQDGKWVPIYTTRDGKELIVDLGPQPFVVWVPEDHWTDPDSDYPALQVSASWDLVVLGRASRDLFAPGTGMADTMRGSGQLVLTDANENDPGHNYIVGHRFNRKMRGWRGFYISVIDTAPPAGNMITARVKGYAVFLMQEDDSPKLPGARPRAVSIDEAPRDDVELNFGSSR